MIFGPKRTPTQKRFLYKDNNAIIEKTTVTERSLTAMSDVSRLISSWRAEPTIGGNIVAWHTIPPRPPRLESLPDDLHPALGEALHASGIQALYRHQSQAWKHIKSGHNTVIVTGTASGKTLCYNLPVLERLLREKDARALYLFPTKALSQDQLSVFSNLLSNIKATQSPINFHPPPYSVYDGDTPAKDRSTIRKKARLLISNPDMLHAGVLPHHTAWADFFRHLDFVVIDEMHAYRGVFGSHVANVLRRLKRIARFYGSQPQFILTSATIANPKELADKLIEEDTYLVDDDGAARGGKNFLIYNPPVVNRELGLRRSALQECVRLADDLLTYDIQTIIFARSRRTVELILTYLRDKVQPLSTRRLRNSDLHRDTSVEGIVRGYRSGYLPQERREIELGLRQGRVRVVVATNALELGIDIGGVGSTMLVGYPGTIAATWQQAGRAGRGNEISLTVLVATADPLDQFLAAHTNYLFERSPEHALINPDNLLILLEHLRCAAFELPFHTSDKYGVVGMSQLRDFLEYLREEGVLHYSGGKYFWMADHYPAQATSLRNTSANNVILQTIEEDLPATIGEIDYTSACWMVHPGAIYLHEGKTYTVQELDLEEKIARLTRTESDYYTEPRRETTVQLQDMVTDTKVQGATIAHGDIRVTSQLIGFRKVRWFTHEHLGFSEITLPPTELLTTGYWLAISNDTIEGLRKQEKWSSDPNRYGPNWSNLRNQVRERDGYQCQVCGLPETVQAHDVHHITPYRIFATREEANRLDNLVTLCPSCHRRAETAVRVRSGLSGLAFVLGHLAPLFLMCDRRDLGVYADPKSPLTNGQPTIVLYDQVPAGIGFSQRLFELHDEIIKRAQDLVAACECTDGCPSCVGPGGEYGNGGKHETLALLDQLNY